MVRRPRWMRRRPALVRIGGIVATVDLGGWREHWARVLRWHARVTTIGEGIPFGMTRDVQQRWRDWSQSLRSDFGWHALGLKICPEVQRLMPTEIFSGLG